MSTIPVFDSTNTLLARQIKRIYKVMEYFGFETGAFSQLTQEYMKNSFNQRTPDIPDVKYYSYGASLEPNKWSVFAASHAIVKRTEGLNDGLVRCVLKLCGGEHRHTNTSGVYNRANGANTREL